MNKYHGTLKRTEKCSTSAEKSIQDVRKNALHVETAMLSFKKIGKKGK
jgi:hypothetical protein